MKIDISYLSLADIQKIRTVLDDAKCAGVLTVDELYAELDSLAKIDIPLETENIVKVAQRLRSCPKCESGFLYPALDVDENGKQIIMKEKVFVCGSCRWSEYKGE